MRRERAAAAGMPGLYPRRGRGHVSRPPFFRQNEWESKGCKGNKNRRQAAIARTAAEEGRDHDNEQQDFRVRPAEVRSPLRAASGWKQYNHFTPDCAGNTGCFLKNPAKVWFWPLRRNDFPYLFPGRLQKKTHKKAEHDTFSRAGKTLPAWLTRRINPWQRMNVARAGDPFSAPRVVRDIGETQTISRHFTNVMPAQDRESAAFQVTGILMKWRGDGKRFQKREQPKRHF